MFWRALSVLCYCPVSDPMHYVSNPERSLSAPECPVSAQECSVSAPVYSVSVLCCSDVPGRVVRVMLDAAKLILLLFTSFFLILAGITLWYNCQIGFLRLLFSFLYWLCKQPQKLSSFSCHVVKLWSSFWLSGKNSLPRKWQIWYFLSSLSL